MKRALVVSFCLGLAVSCTRLDTLPGAYYPCHRDGGSSAECPGEWHCGVEDRCLPNQPGPWACRDQADCYGWHCGAQGVCYSLDDAQAVACRPDGGDCAPGWRCGVPAGDPQLSVCHDTSVAAPYTCRDDSDCEQAWRCGPDGVCLDTSAEGLRPNAGIPVASISSEAPLWNQRPRLLSITADHRTRTSCSTVDAWGWTTDVVVGDELVRVSWFPGGLRTCQDAGSPMQWGAVDRGAVPPGLSPVALLSLGDATLAIASDGGLFSLSFDGGALGASLQSLSFAPTKLKQGLHRGVAFAFDEAHLARLEGGSWTEADLSSLGTYDAGINDVSEFGDVDQQVDPVVVIATTRGLFRVHRSGPVTGVYAPDLDCPTDPWASPPSVLSLSQEDLHGTLASFVRANEDGSLFSSLFTPGTSNYAGSCELLPNSLVNPSVGCYVTDAGPGPVQIEVSAPDGGSYSSRFILVVETAAGELDTRRCGNGLVFADWPQVKQFSAPGMQVSKNNPRVLAFADDRGHLWASDRDFLLPFSTPLMVSAPTMMVGREPLFAGNLHGPPTSGLPDLASESVFAFQPGAGFFSIGPTYPNFGSLQNAPDWVILDLPYFPDTLAWDVVAQNQSPSIDFPIVVRWPGRATSRPLGARHDLPDGGTIFIGTSGDLLLSADITDRLAARADAPTLRPAVVPLSRGNITSLVALPKSPQGASYAGGYLIANGRLFRFRADNWVVWKTDELDLGLAEAALVWSDRERGRVALRDGSVFSLPSRTRIAPPLGAASTLLDVVERCGHTFALTAGAVLRLEADAASQVGVWTPVSVSSSPEALAAGKLHADAEGVHLVDDEGRHELLRADCVP